MGLQHPDTASPCLAFAPGCRSCPLPGAPGRECCKDAACAAPGSRCHSPAWTWHTLGIDERGKGLLAVLGGGDLSVLGWVLWCLHGQPGPGLLSVYRQQGETWISSKTCWKRKLSSIIALVRTGLGTCRDLGQTKQAGSRLYQRGGSEWHQEIVWEPGIKKRCGSLQKAGGAPSIAPTMLTAPRILGLCCALGWGSPCQPGPQRERWSWAVAVALPFPRVPGADMGWEQRPWWDLAAG